MGYYDNEKYLINLMENEIQDKFSEIEKELEAEFELTKEQILNYRVYRLFKWIAPFTSRKRI